MHILKKLACATILLGILGSVCCAPSKSNNIGETELTAEEKKAKLVKDNMAYLLREKKLPDGIDGRVLEGAVFPKNADLSGANLTGAELTGANLTSVNLTKALLSDVILTNAILKNTNFTEANLKNTTFTNTQLDDTNFTDAIFSDGTDFSVITKRLSLGNFPSANFTNATLNNAKFDGLELISSTSFKNAKIKNGSFIDCSFNRINMNSAELNNANFTDSRLEYPLFVSAQLKSANFTNAYLQLYEYTSNEGFKDADLSNANFKGAKKTGNVAITLDFLTKLIDKPTWPSGEPNF